MLFQAGHPGENTPGVLCYVIILLNRTYIITNYMLEYYTSTNTLPFPYSDVGLGSFVIVVDVHMLVRHDGCAH